MKYIVGIDEVGRGPIAGPVAVCAFLCQPDFPAQARLVQELPKLKDSKKLSKIQREKWFRYLKSEKEQGACDYFVSYVSSESIDKFGINACIKKALNTALAKVAQNGDEVSVYLDGGLKASDEFTHQETVIRGDELHPVISCASIIAKVSRDKVMEDFSKSYPQYGFEKHSGYGTKAHYEAIKKHGMTPLHRKTFLS